MSQDPSHSGYRTSSWVDGVCVEDRAVDLRRNIILQLKLLVSRKPGTHGQTIVLVVELDTQKSIGVSGVHAQYAIGSLLLCWAEEHTCRGDHDFPHHATMIASRVLLSPLTLDLFDLPEERVPLCEKDANNIDNISDLYDCQGRVRGSNCALLSVAEILRMLSKVKSVSKTASIISTSLPMISQIERSSSST